MNHAQNDLDAPREISQFNHECRTHPRESDSFTILFSINKNPIRHPMKPKSNPFLTRFACAASFVLTLSQNVQSANFWWDGTTGNWDTVSNWSSDVDGTTDPAARPLASASDVLNFNTTPGNAASSTLYLNGSRGSSGILATMNFNTSGATTLLGGVSGTPANNDLFISTFTVNAGSGAVTIGDTAASPTAQVNLKSGSISFTNNSSSLLTLANGLNSYGSGSTTTLTFTGSGNILSGGVIGNGTGTNVVALTKNGAGILTLKGANSYSSTTALNAGTIQIGVASVGSVGSITSSAVGRGTLNLNGGTISSDSATARTILNAVTYSNASTFGNATNNGKLTFSAAVNLGTLQKAMTVNSDVQFDGILSGALGGISLGTSTGFGKLTLTNNSNSFTGAVGFAANSGTLRITSSGALGVGPKTVTNTGASSLVPVTGANLLELDSNGGADISLASNISFTTSGSAGVILNTAGNNTIAGNFNMTSGNGHTKIISNGGTLTLTGTFTSNATDRELDLAGSASDNIFSGALVNGTSTALLTKSGTGTWTVSGGSNTFTGRTRITGGTLKLTNNLALQNSAFDTSGAGTLDVTAINTPTFGGLTSAGDLVLPSNVTSLTLNPSSGAQTYTGNLSGGTALQLIKTGSSTQVLGGTNTYSGDTVINAGSLQINTAGAIGGANITMSGTGNSALVLNNSLTAGSGKTLTIKGGGVGGFFGALTNVTGATGVSEWQGDVTIGDATGARVGAQGGTLKISGNIGDTGAGRQLVIRNSGGKTILSGTNTYTGETLINASGGELQIEGGAAIHDSGLVNITNSAGNIFRVSGSETIGALTGGGANGKVVIEASQTLTLSSGTQSFTGVVESSGSLTVNGATQTFTNTNTYSGATTVSAGTLFVTGALSNSAVTVESAGTVGGSGTLGNGLSILAGGNLDLTGATLGANSTGILSVTGGTVTLGALTFADLIGWDASLADLGTYELIDGAFTVNLGSTAYTNPTNAFDFGNGKKGYFTSGSLNAVIIPEPNAAALLGTLGTLILLRRRRVA